MSDSEQRKTAIFTSLKGADADAKTAAETSDEPGDCDEFGRNITNESDRNLSKAFDMEISFRNRPFDVEYLGTE